MSSHDDGSREATRHRLRRPNIPLPNLPRVDREQWRAIRQKARHPLWWLPDPAAAQDESFLRIWQHLRQATHVQDGRHDSDDWRGRTGPFAMCCIRVPAGALIDEFANLRLALEAQPMVRIHPDHFLHVPVLELGFVVEHPSRRDEIDLARLDEFIALAENPVRDFPNFLIELGGANAFLDAPFIDIHDGGWLSRIHRRLLDFMVVPPDTRYPYLPHMTVAHFTGDAPVGRLPARLAEWRDTSFGAFMVGSVDVVTMATSEPYPDLDVVHEFPLGTRRPAPAFMPSGPP